MLLMRVVSPAMTMQFSVQQFKGFCTVNWSPWVRLPMSSSSVTCWGVWEETLSGNELNCGVCQLVPAWTALKTKTFLVMSTQCLLTTWNIHWILLPWSFVQLKFKLKDHHFVIWENIHLHCKDTSERGYIITMGPLEIAPVYENDLDWESKFKSGDVFHFYLAIHRIFVHPSHILFSLELWIQCPSACRV